MCASAFTVLNKTATTLDCNSIIFNSILLYCQSICFSSTSGHLSFQSISAVEHTTFLFTHNVAQQQKQQWPLYTRLLMLKSFCDLHLNGRDHFRMRKCPFQRPDPFFTWKNQPHVTVTSVKYIFFRLSGYRSWENSSETHQKLGVLFKSELKSVAVVFWWKEIPGFNLILLLRITQSTRNHRGISLKVPDVLPKSAAADKMAAQQETRHRVTMSGYDLLIDLDLAWRKLDFKKWRSSLKAVIDNNI